MTGMRNRMIHGYDDIDMDIVWNTSQESIPLTLTERRTYEKTGTVMLVYAVQSSRRRQGRQR